MFLIVNAIKHISSFLWFLIRHNNDPQKIDRGYEIFENISGTLILRTRKVNALQKQKSLI